MIWSPKLSRAALNPEMGKEPSSSRYRRVDIQRDCKRQKKEKKREKERKKKRWECGKGGENKKSSRQSLTSYV